MNRISILAPIVVGAAALAGASIAAPASGDVAEVPQARLTMMQAVTIAEEMGNGRVTRVKLDDDDAMPVYKLTVVAPGEAAQKFKIAAAGGRILSRERDER
jgi:uncharacterized membrane protein YkoI